MLCEDGSGEEFLHGLTVNGEIFPFAKNAVVLPEAHNAAVPAGNYSGSEWAGACYSPQCLGGASVQFVCQFVPRVSACTSAFVNGRSGFGACTVMKAS